jgi:hypothetical protein
MGEEENAESGVAMAATDRPLSVRVQVVEDERVPEGMTCLASFLGERLIARCAVPDEAAQTIEAKGFFLHPVRLALVAREESPGLQCRLFAIADVVDQESENDNEEEPWASSVPGSSYEASIAEPEDDEEAQVLIYLGDIVRFDRDRKHPESLPLETADVLRRVVSGEAVEVVDKLLEDL